MFEVILFTFAFLVIWSFRKFHMHKIFFSAYRPAVREFRDTRPSRSTFLETTPSKRTGKNQTPFKPALSTISEEDRTSYFSPEDESTNTSTKSKKQNQKDEETKIKRY